MRVCVCVHKRYVCGHAASCLGLLEAPEAAEAASLQCFRRMMAREVLSRWSESPCQEALQLQWEVISAKSSAMAPQKLSKVEKIVSVSASWIDIVSICFSSIASRSPRKDTVFSFFCDWVTFELCINEITLDNQSHTYHNNAVIYFITTSQQVIKFDARYIMEVFRASPLVLSICLWEVAPPPKFTCPQPFVGMKKH